MDSVADFPGIEFKGHGRQVVAPGSSHPNTGKPYVWIADEFAPSISEARMAPDVLIELIRRPERASMTEAGAYSPDELAEMLTGLNSEDYRNHDKRVGVMMACHTAPADEGRENLTSWPTSIHPTPALPRTRGPPRGIVPPGQ